MLTNCGQGNYEIKNPLDNDTKKWPFKVTLADVQQRHANINRDTEKKTSAARKERERGKSD